MCAHPNPGRTRFAAEELLRRLFQFASVVYLMTVRTKHSVLHKFVHHLAEMPSETQKLSSALGKGTETLQGLSGHIMLNCSNRRFCVVLWQQNVGAGSATETLFSLLGSLSNPSV